MNHRGFWSLIDGTRQASDGVCERQAEVLTELLRQQEPEDIIAFHRMFLEFVYAAYTWDLWGAAYIIHGGCSDDCFEYFRRWLIGHGEAAYMAAVQNPESLVPLLDVEDAGTGGHECEELGYAADDAYEQRTGQAMPPLPMLDTELPAEPRGEKWNEEELAQRFPQLASACGWDT